MHRRKSRRLNQTCVIEQVGVHNGNGEVSSTMSDSTCGRPMNVRAKGTAVESPATPTSVASALHEAAKSEAPPTPAVQCQENVNCTSCGQRVQWKR